MESAFGRLRGEDITMTFFTKVVLQTIVLFTLWMLLSGTTNAYHIVLGIICSLTISLLNVGRHGSSSQMFPLLQVLLYLPWLFLRIILSSLKVTKTTLTPTLPIAPTLFTYKFNLKDHRAIALLGNSITLTPGTVTVEVSSTELIIHTLSMDMTTDVTSGLMEQKIARVFGEDRNS